jgi:hypothetical protein
MMPATFDVEKVLTNISEQDKIALLSGNTETMMMIYKTPAAETNRN